MTEIATAQPGMEPLPRTYSQLRSLARFYLRGERHGHTLEPTGLVHEAYLRMLEQRAGPRDSGHFVALAAQMMRRILVNHALSRKTAKRGHGVAATSLDDAGPIPQEAESIDVLALSEALSELGSLDPRQAQIVELRYFVGLSIEETAAALSISPATVKREWSTAKLFLHERLAN
ncbi:RNA polymerase sigma factor [Burkholderiales bacterium 8X]|nr:RNA polymerase sigma factor [Burkholderiales bacterium 8X]